jgi:cytochrome b561
MPIRNQSERWGVPSIFLHWLTVLLVLGLLVVGLVMTELPNSAFKVKVYALHKSIGLTVLGGCCGACSPARRHRCRARRAGRTCWRR